MSLQLKVCDPSIDLIACKAFHRDKGISISCLKVHGNVC